jgi:hypothetical protein
MYHWRCLFTEDSEQSLVIESQTEPVLRREFGKLLLPIVIVSWANVFQVVFENGAMLVLVKKAVPSCALHGALHLFRECCRCFCHLTICRCTRAYRSPFVGVCIADFAMSVSDTPRVLKDAWAMHHAHTNFCKAKGKERGAREPSSSYKRYKGANYGIPDCSCRRSNDGALRANHRRLPETGRMVTVNRT